MFPITNIEFLSFRYYNKYIVYEPHRGICFYTNISGYKLLENTLKGNLVNECKEDQEYIKSRLSEIETKPIIKIKSKNKYLFTKLVLLLTHDCNMRCAYCYSFGGKSKQKLPLKSGQSAIDYVSNNIVENNLKSFTLSFHGGGEPTLAWDLLTGLHSYAKSRCGRLGIEFKCRLTSNGLWSNEQASWISTNIDSVLFSLDGPESIMNIHRPRKNNEPSIPIITNSISIFKKNNKSIRIRATISNHSVKRINEILNYFISLGANTIQLEPLSYAGRSIESNIYRPNASIFCTQFFNAYKKGLNSNVKVNCSYFRPTNFSEVFCGATGNVLILTSEGIITTCHRVDSENIKGSDNLLIGKINPDNRYVSFDISKIDDLEKIPTRKPKKCFKCIAKYHCAGGCYAQNASISNIIWEPDHYRCSITKYLFKLYLLDFLNISVT